MYDLWWLQENIHILYIWKEMLLLHFQGNTHFRTFSLLVDPKQAWIMVCSSNTHERTQGKYQKIHGLYFYENIAIILDSYQDVIRVTADVFSGVYFLFDSTQSVWSATRKRNKGKQGKTIIGYIHQKIIWVRKMKHQSVKKDYLMINA